MIFVLIRVDGKKDMAGLFVEKVLKKMPKLLSEMFEGQSENIDIKIEPFGMMDYHTMDLNIVIFSDGFPSLQNSENFSEKIEKLIPKGVKTSIFISSK